MESLVSLGGESGRRFLLKLRDAHDLNDTAPTRSKEIEMKSQFSEIWLMQYQWRGWVICHKIITWQRSHPWFASQNRLSLGVTLCSWTSEIVWMSPWLHAVGASSGYRSVWLQTGKWVAELLDRASVGQARNDSWSIPLTSELSLVQVNIPWSEFTRAGLVWILSYTCVTCEWHISISIPKFIFAIHFIGIRL